MSATKKNSFQTFFGTAAEMATFTDCLLGDKFFQTDTSLMYAYPGALPWVFDTKIASAVLAAGTALIGKVGIDQTTPGTTNKVTAEGIAQSVYKTEALAASAVIKASAGILFGFQGVNNSGSDQYVHIYDSATVPANGVSPVVVIFVPALSNFSFDAGFHGLAFAAGMSWSNSSTLATKTIGSADIWLVASYK